MGISDIHITPSHAWLERGGQPLIIAGPCSAESESQVMEVAASLASDQRVQLLRAGVWKPRTRPNSFEGRGSEALVWLSKAQEAFGKPFVIEVANAEHVKLALDAGMRYLWIGARTTVNPFSVQEIADALRGTDVPVFVKNPLNPDLELWIGAIERLSKAGVHKLVAVHRGFSTYGDHHFRNTPKWEIPIELKTKLPHLEILVDPSHIAGSRPLVREVAQRGLNLAFDGLMIETHPDPDQALSDPKQQIALADFASFLDGLETPQAGFEDAVSIDRLQRLRSLIDEIDASLIEQLKKRMDVVDEIGRYKAESGVAVFQLERWLDIIADRTSQGEEMDMDAALVQGIWKAIHNASIKRQTEIVNTRLKERDIFGI
jgi:chorismate mutase